MPKTSRKIKTPGQLQKIINQERKHGRRTVFTNGCFDIIHIGHVRILKQARDLGDILVVGINSDASVTRLKGKERPIVPLKERMEMLAALGMVDYVTSFGEDTPEKIIRRLNPDFLVKGGDYKKTQVVGAQYVEHQGGKVVILPFVKGKSSSFLLKRIKELS